MFNYFWQTHQLEKNLYRLKIATVGVLFEHSKKWMSNCTTAPPPRPPKVVFSSFFTTLQKIEQYFYMRGKSTFRKISYILTIDYIVACRYIITLLGTQTKTWLINKHRLPISGSPLNESQIFSSSRYTNYL